VPEEDGAAHRREREPAQAPRRRIGVGRDDHAQLRRARADEGID
jgi:hypothetical protein